MKVLKWMLWDMKGEMKKCEEMIEELEDGEVEPDCVEIRRLGWKCRWRLEMLSMITQLVREETQRLGESRQGLGRFLKALVRRNEEVVKREGEWRETWAEMMSDYVWVKDKEE